MPDASLSPLPPWAMDESSAMLLRVKAVPGASRDSIAGVLGDRLKVRVSAPPEGGRANQAIIRVLAQALSVDARCIQLVHGTRSALKTFRVHGLVAASLRALDDLHA